MRASAIIFVAILAAPFATAFVPVAMPAKVAVLTGSGVGFIVVETRDIAALRATLGDRVVADTSAWADGVPSDPLWPSQWGPDALDMPHAWDIEGGSASVKVAVIDSGVDTTHPDFAGVPIEIGTDYVQDGAAPPDFNGHGTHVAGIIAASRDNAIGIAGLARVTVLSIRVFGASGSGSCLDVALAVLEATARGASIINLSLECGTDFVPLHLAIDAATQAGVLVVAAGGNNALNGGQCPAYPAAYPEVVSVAALENATAAWPNSCRAAGIELAAPGANVLSTWPGGRFVNASGTSMAAPHVSAIAALVKSRFPSMDAAAIRARLDATAVDIGDPGRDDASGYGRVDPVAALSS